VRGNVVGLLLYPIFFVFLLCIFAQLGFAQNPNASLVGVILDGQGLPVPGARVTATNSETGAIRAGSTSREGTYALSYLPPGRYSVTVTARGFRTFRETEILLETAEVRRLTVRLEVGNLEEKITVEAPLGRLDGETASRGELIPDRLVNSLPLNERNYADLAVLAPGVYHQVGDDEQGEGLSASGARSDAAGFTVDGLVNRSDRNGIAGITLSLDAIREFDVRTSTVSAETGRSGGAHVMVISKSGSNRFSGTLFGYMRHDALDARNVFAPPDESFPLRRQQYGGSFGGPIRRDRLFFFGAYERLRERRSLAMNTISPNTDWLKGDFQNVRGAGADGIWGNEDDTNRVLNPSTGEEFPSPNIISDSMIDGVSRKILPFIPEANMPETLDGYAAVGHTRNDRHMATGRIDTVWNSGASLSARWSGQWGDEYDPFAAFRNFYPGFGRQTKEQLNSFDLIWTTGVRKNWLNETRFGYFTHTRDTLGENSETDYVSEFGLPGLSTDSSVWGFPTIRIDGFPDFGDRPNDPSKFTVRNFQFADIVTRASGRHTLKAGVDVIRSMYRELDLRNIRGDFRFRGRNTDPDQKTSGGFRSFADFMLGLLDQTRRQVGTDPADMRGWQMAFFIQDDWRVTQKLTLNMGLRYERQTPLSEIENRFANFIPERGEVVLAGDPSLPNALVYTDNDNFAPRVGFAYRPFSDGRTVIRGGVGIYHSLEAFNVTRQQLAVSYPFIVREAFARKKNKPNSLTFGDPFPSGSAEVQGLDTPLGMAVDYKVPEYYQYNLTVQRELGRDLVLEVAYVGSQGRYLGRRYNLNQPIPIGLDADGTLLTIRPFPDYGDIQYQDQTVSSSYNALQTSIRRRMSWGLTLLASYSFSRMIDEGSISTGNPTNVSTSGAQKSPQNIYDMKAERGLSDRQRKHQFSAAFAWELPFGSNRRFLAAAPTVVDAIIRDWQVSGIVTLLSGRAFTPQYESGDFATQRPDLVSDPYDNILAGLWFNPNAFARPVATPEKPSLYGNAGRNILIGPDYKNVDFAIMRIFRLGEGTILQARGEAFNLFNHPNYQLPVFLLDNSNVGRVTATANNAREWQLALRLIF
jgi:hypothetical protein